MNCKTMLQALREVGYNIKEISKHTNISISTISKILAGKSVKPKSYTVNMITDFFNKNLKDVEIGDLESINQVYLVETPDGYQRPGNFMNKGVLPCIEIKTENHTLTASNLHNIQKENGDWVAMNTLCVDDIVMTISGPESIISITDVGLKDCVDIQILHENQRYFCNGFVSHNTGKSFVALGIAAQALKDGYDMIFYFDSEGGGMGEFFKNRGCDLDKIEQILVKSVEDAVTKILGTYTEIEEYQKTNPDFKALFILDSLGALVANKFINDASNGKVASEMGGRAKLCLDPDTLVLMEDGSFKPIKDINIGDKVVTHLNKIKPVIDKFTTKHEKIISIQCGSEVVRMSSNHQMLVKRLDGEIKFIRADELKKADKIAKINQLAMFADNYDFIDIDSIETKYEENDLIDIEVEDDHTFCITNECMISHNCNNLIKGCTIPALITNVALVIVNHIYDDPASMFNSKVKHQGGGKGVQYMARLAVQCTKSLQKNEDTEAGFYKATVLKFMAVKNSFVKPFIETEMLLNFNEGPNPYFGLFKPAVRMGFIEVPTKGYYCVPSWSDKKLRLKDIMEGPDREEIWNSFLDKFNEESIKEMSYNGGAGKEVNLEELEQEVLGENIDQE